AMTIPAALKQRPEQGCDGEKWILRKACEDLLPPEIVWRGKLQFDEGSGFSDYLADHAGRAFDAGAIEPAGSDVSPEEALYRQLLRDSDAHTDAVMGLTDHWRSGRTVDHAA
ncbi:MAG: asparagine synthase-related protein, partial [Halofilum sp. (in: g-proteobacteria)]